jgi:outer membrane protein OmpA-like peptidoglycan-associated protein
MNQRLCAAAWRLRGARRSRPELSIWLGTITEEFDMKQTAIAFSVAIAVALLASCGGQTTTYAMQTPSGASESVTMPKGTMTGAASVGDASALAKEIQDSNNNVMTAYDRVNGKMNSLQASENKDLQTSEQALTKLEQLSNQQGSGQITLFFAEGSAAIDPAQNQRLVSFLDYISRDAHGRKVILVSLGSASSIGNPAFNKKLSVERGEAPLPVINQYLVNIPHQVFKVSGVGDMYAPKRASVQVDARYQSVQIIAAYDKADLAN